MHLEHIIHHQNGNKSKSPLSSSASSASSSTLASPSNNSNSNNMIVMNATNPITYLEKQEHKLAHECFFPNTLFLSWKDYFTVAPKTPNSAKGTYVTWFERSELLAGLAFLLYILRRWFLEVYRYSRHPEEFIPGAQGLDVYFVIDPRLKFSFSGIWSWFGGNNNNNNDESNQNNWFGPGYDIADFQWRSIDLALPMLTAGLIFYVLISRLLRFVSAKIAANNNLPGGNLLLKNNIKNNNEASLTSKITTFVFGVAGSNTLHTIGLAFLNVLVIFGIHGYGAFLLLSILMLHYVFTRYAAPFIPRWSFLLIMWTSLTYVMMQVEWNKGFKDSFTQSRIYVNFLSKILGAVAKNYNPADEMLEWRAVFPMQVLRLIAFSVDFLEARDKGETKAREVTQKHRTTCHICGQIAAKCNPQGKLIATEIQPLCYKARTDTPRPLQEYSFLNFIAYILYLPLYIAGPVSSFNAFASHIQTPQKALSIKDIIRYAFRVVCLYYCLIGFQHLVYVNSIRLHQNFVGKYMSIEGQNGLMYFTLAFLWLKFSFIWKFFRLFGLIDGIEAPEDMNRCFSNTVRVSEFWRDWHSSFNLWIVRYMYIPLGGNRYKILVVFPIFFFIAIWHDTNMVLIWWAMIICVNFAIELLLTAYCSGIGYWKKTGYYYRYWVMLGGVYTIMALILANSLGFGAVADRVVKSEEEQGKNGKRLLGDMNSNNNNNGAATTTFISQQQQHQDMFEKYFTAKHIFNVCVWMLGCFCSCGISLIDREIEKNRNRKAMEELRHALIEDGTYVTSI